MKLHINMKYRTVSINKKDNIGLLGLMQPLAGKQGQRDYRTTIYELWTDER